LNVKLDEFWQKIHLWNHHLQQEFFVHFRKFPHVFFLSCTPSPLLQHHQPLFWVLFFWALGIKLTVLHILHTHTPSLSYTLASTVLNSITRAWFCLFLNFLKMEWCGVYSHCVSQLFIPLHCYVVFYFMNIPLFVYSPVDI
jgi:hypothetical protein